ncbi:hypothetical protein [Litoribacterium kuwaitense]|uniref:hypothetical protein n=1 Tax=Litoribacterium kuwaitense TaxID=1398745 RepID=UPI0028B0070E|nr:hypothetical protein [Litoribacterium kuwaitense]
MNQIKNYLYENKQSAIYLLLLSLFMGGAIIVQAYLLVTIIDGVFCGSGVFKKSFR